MNKKLMPVESFRDFMHVPLLANLEDYFSEGGLWPSMRNLVVDQKMKLDVTESENAYSVKAELPGVDKKDIKVSVQGNQVSISCEINKSNEEKQGETVIRSERHSGKLFRSFTLGSELDDKKTTAKYQDGVLDLVLPKKVEANTVKQIVIE
jgi:HSP20 family protein